MGKTPLQTDENGVERDQQGRFKAGNRAARGNGVARKAARFRAKLFSSTTGSDFAEIVGVLLDKAKAGEPWAVKLALSYLIGEPQPVDLLERMEAIEANLERLGGNHGT